MKTVSRRTLWITIIVILVLGTFGWVATSQSSVRWLVEMSKPYWPAQLKLAEISGSLSDEIIISELSWHAEDFKIVLSDTHVNCDWLAFIRGNYQCRSIISDIVTVNTKASGSPDTNAPLAHIERIQPFNSMHNAGISHLKIKQILWQTQQPSGIEQKSSIQELVITDLAWSKNTLKWKEAKGKSGQTSAVLKGQITPLENWSIQLEANIGLQNNHIQLTGEGDIFGESDWQVKSTGQVNSLSTARINFRDGKPMISALLNAPAQDLSWLYPSLSIKQARVPIKFDWVKAELEIDSKLRVADHDIDVINTLTIDNVLNWHSSLQGQATISTQLSPKILNKQLSAYIPQSAEALLLNSKDLSETIATRLNSSYEVNGGHLLADNEFYFGKEVMTNAKLQLDIKDNQYENLSVTGKLTIRKSPDILDIKIQQLISEFSVKQEDPASSIKYFISGSADKVEHQTGILNKLSWQVKYDDQVNATLFVNDANININSDSIPFSQTAISIDGLVAKHFLTVNSRINNVDSSLSLIGAISNIQDEIWRAQNLKLLLERGQRQFNISSAGLTIKDNGFQVDNLCLNEVGSFCGTFRQIADQLKVNLLVNDFSTTNFIQWSDELGLDLPYDADGLLSGYINLEQTANQLELFDVSISSPKLTISTDDADLWLDSLQVKSTKSADDIGLDVQWRRFHSESTISSKKISFDSSQGIVRADLNKSDDIIISLLMPENIVSVENFATQEDIQTNETAKEDLITIAIPKLDVKATYSGESVYVKSTIGLLGDDHLNLDLRSTWPLNAQSQLEGDLDISLTQFNWLKQWQSRIDDIDLVWQQTNHISGPIDQLSITGEGKIDINNFVMQEIGLQVADSSLMISSNNNKVLLYGLLKNKQGEVNLNAKMTLWPNIEMTADLIGENLTVIDTVEQKLVLSPKFYADYRDDHLKLTGDVVFDQANITLNKLPVTKVDVSDDEVFLGQQQDKDKSFSYDITLNLATGDDVAFQGFGLSSKLTGRLKLLAQKGRTININGELQLIGGKFEAYKQNLIIEQGQLIFLGASNNPGIQFTATRTIDDIKVGVVADGTLLKPRLTLYSVPAMPEENILALLLTGRSIESLTVSEGNALANAALSIGVDGANRIAQKLAESLGIENIQITAKNTATSSSLNIETAINERLTAGYGTTIDSQNETQSGWIIEYRLSPKVSIEAISGREVSASITYKNQFDSDKAKKPSATKEDKN